MKVIKIIAIIMFVTPFFFGCSFSISEDETLVGVDTEHITRGLEDAPPATPGIIPREHWEFIDWEDGLFVTYWERYYDRGDAYMDVFSDGFAVHIEYSTVETDTGEKNPCIVAGKGINPCWGETISWDVSGTITTEEHGVYGWLWDPLVEYYIGRGGGHEELGIYTTDQGTYTLYLSYKDQENVKVPELPGSKFLQFNCDGPKTSPVNMAQHYAGWERLMATHTLTRSGYEWFPIETPYYCVMAAEIYSKMDGDAIITNINIEEKMTFNPVNQIIPYNATSLAIEVWATSPWEISPDSIPAWASVYPVSGGGGTTTVTVNVDSNLTGFDRGAYFDFYFTGTNDWRGMQIVQSSQPGTSTTDPWVYAHDIDRADNTRATIGIAVRNFGGTYLSDFTVQYYFTTENGKTPVVEDVYSPFNTQPVLRQISGDTNGNQWSVILDFAGTSIPPLDRTPVEFDLAVFRLRYSDGSTFSKKNDWSQPIDDETRYPTLTIAVYDNTGTLIGGSTPPNIPASAYFRSDYSKRQLTVADDSDYAYVVCQDKTPEWTSQDWISEKVYAGNNSIIRLRNLWSGKYLTVADTSDYARVLCQPFNPFWSSQNWVVEQAGDYSTRLRNVWSGKYLTVTSSSEGAEVRAQNLNTGWSSQKWWIE